MKISVVCPFYNEEAIIVPAVRQFLDIMGATFADWELILVNDGSRDSSLASLSSSLQAGDHARVKVLSYATNKGRGHALKTGIDAAAGDIVVTTEVDGSWGKDIVKRLVDVLAQNPETDVAVASPHLPGGGLVNVPPHRVFLTTVGNRLLRIFVSRSLTMYTGMTRAYRREVIQPLPVSERGKEFHLEVLMKLMTLGFDIREIPATITWGVHKNPGQAGPTRKSSTPLLKTTATHLAFCLLGKPAQYFTLAALFALLGGIAFLGIGLAYLLLGKVAAFFGTMGLLLLVLSLLLAGFAGVFVQQTSVLRGEWLAAYPPDVLDRVARRKVRLAFPPRP